VAASGFDLAVCGVGVEILWEGAIWQVYEDTFFLCFKYLLSLKRFY